MASIRNLLPILLVLALIGTIAYAVSTQISFPNDGNVVVTVELTAFMDEELTIEVTELNWVDIEPASTIDKVIYLNSTSNVPVNITMTTTDWTWNPPEAAGHVTLTWDREGETIDAGEMLAATLTLTVDTIIQTSFDFGFTVNIDVMED